MTVPSHAGLARSPKRRLAHRPTRFSDYDPAVAGNVKGIILPFLGGFFLIRGLPGVMQLLRSRSWQRVSGTMLGSESAGYRTQATAGHMGANVQRTVFAYSYEVGGQA